MAYTRKSTTTTARRSSVKWSMPLAKQHLVYIGAGIGVIALGFVLLSMGMFTSWDNPMSVSVAPVVLVLGYCVVVPWAIMWRPKNNNIEQS